jgi:hypothetical protein
MHHCLSIAGLALVLSMGAHANEPATAQQPAEPTLTPAQLAAANKPAASENKDLAAEEKKLVLPNASDFVNEGIGCGTAK